MQIRDLGEDATIERLVRQVPVLDFPATIQGPGADAAILHPPEGMDLVWTVDCCREGIHFNLDFMPYDSVGWRGLAAGLSDLAGMGAEPLGFLCDVGASPDMEVEDLEKVYQGFKRLVALHGCPLLGGNLSRSQSLVLSISVLGAVPEGNVVSRAGANPGDGVWVTGFLGKSRAGFELLASGTDIKGNSDMRALVDRFLYPKPRLEAGQLLVGLGIRTMMDLSDGIAIDVPRLAKSSGVSIEIDQNLIAVMPSLNAAMEVTGDNEGDFLIGGGEDYELLFVAPPDFSVPPEIGAHQIGCITEGKGEPIVTLITSDGASKPLSGPSFRHFS